MKRFILIMILLLKALLLCTAAISAQEGSVVLFTGNISPEGLESIYRTMSWNPAGKVAVVLSTGESEKSNFLSPELIGDFVQVKL